MTNKNNLDIMLGNPSGCTFYPRSCYSDNRSYRTEAPEFREVATGHFISCHYTENLSLKGALERQSAVGPRGAEDSQQIDDMRKKRSKINAELKKD